jgi:hypothetical protein
LPFSLDNFFNEVIDSFSIEIKQSNFLLALLAKLLGFVIWIITFIDYYATAPVGLRYFLCLFPNAGLLFCIQVLQQYERRSGQLIL